MTGHVDLFIHKLICNVVASGKGFQLPRWSRPHTA